MFIKLEDMRLITQIRRGNGSIGSNEWPDVNTMADQALEGLLHYYENRLLLSPDIGHII
jgi:hypothetical protein